MVIVQRLAHNLVLVLLVFISACSPSDRQAVDKLNSLSYAYHYKNLDSTTVYARRALLLAENYDGGRAEAMNNLAFVSIARMDYRLAEAQLDSVISLTDNQIEILIARIQQMRLCQRRSLNKDFYDYSEKARQALARIEEERSSLTERQQRRMVYAESELAIVTSTYYYYVGLERPSVEAINSIDPNGPILNDTAQYLNYIYQIGAGGIITDGSSQEISQIEWGYLSRCEQMAHESGDIYWEANALQGMSEHLYGSPDGDTELAGTLAQQSLRMFEEYGDVYQIAGAYRTLASCYWNIGDYHSALACLDDALRKDSAINQAPDLVASIRERLSLTYSAIDDKPRSDYNRNIYLDMQDSTRQDRQLEARVEQLDYTLSQLNIMMAAVLLMIVVLLLSLLLFSYLRARRDKAKPLDSLLEPLEEWNKENRQRIEQLNERYETIEEERVIAEMNLEKNRRRNIENRAKVFLANSVMPLIDRILHEVDKLNERKESTEVRLERYHYVAELTEKINDYNDVLTQWIQLRQGQLSLRVESFRLQDLFDVVKRSRMAFRMKGIDLCVEDTNAVVKADRVMTLFMLNTLTDNARKFTPEGGKVTVSALETDEYVELSVADTGIGIPEDKLQDIFNHKVSNGHGFGLMNCRGIIDQYKKASKIFSVSQLTAESRLGEGSRFAFRLPKGIVRILVGAFLLAAHAFSGAVVAVPSHSNVSTPQAQDSAAIYSLRVYDSNIAGAYSQAIAFADSAIRVINEKIPADRPRMELRGESGLEPAEIVWFHDSLSMPYETILELRNEVAVAALALHEWETYRYNNKVYTQLYKEISADGSLQEYVRTMQASSQVRTIAVILLILLIVVILMSYYLLYYRHRLYYRFCVEQVEKINRMLLDDSSDEEKYRRIAEVDTHKYSEPLRNIVDRILEALHEGVSMSQGKNLDIELAQDELHRIEYESERYYIANNVLDNCLSTLKHETMYYPNRISQLLPSDDNGEQLPALHEVVAYYKELYSILSEQAMRQLDTMRPDSALIDYLLELLRQECGSKVMDNLTIEQINDDSEIMKSSNSKVVCLRIAMPGFAYRDLFVPEVRNIPFLVCRQIVREIADATNLHACGIRTQKENESTIILITLPQFICNHLKL